MNCVHTVLIFTRLTSELDIEGLKKVPHVYIILLHTVLFIY